MKIIILYRPESEHARVIEEYLHDFSRNHPEAKADTLNIDSIEGSETAKLYGVVQYPAVLAINNDGQMQQLWEGIERLPLMNDLAYYSQQ